MKTKPIPFSKLYLITLFRYEAETGVVYWRVRSNQGVYKNDIAGSLNPQGYLVVGIKGRRYLLHRIIWLMVHNENVQMIDHIDGNKINNKLSNLRASTSRHNMCNLPLHREGHLPGTTYNKLERKWKSQIYIDGRKVGLGTYCTQQEAHEAYTRKLKSMDTVQGEIW